ncbi:MAG: hypothetical protein WA740_09305 [Candidatus Binataceae bacterium]
MPPTINHSDHEYLGGAMKVVGQIVAAVGSMIDAKNSFAAERASVGYMRRLKCSI